MTWASIKHTVKFLCNPWYAEKVYDETNWYMSLGRRSDGWRLGVVDGILVAEDSKGRAWNIKVEPRDEIKEEKSS